MSQEFVFLLLHYMFLNYYSFYPLILPSLFGARSQSRYITVNSRNLFEKQKSLYYNETHRRSLHRNVVVEGARESSRFFVDILGSDSRARRRRLCRRGTPPRDCGILRRVLRRYDDKKKRVRRVEVTRDWAEAYNCRRTPNWIQKAATAHNDTTGCHYSHVQVSCRHLKGDRGRFSRGTAIFGRFIIRIRVNDICILARGKKSDFSRRPSLLRVAFNARENYREHNKSAIFWKGTVSSSCLRKRHLVLWSSYYVYNIVNFW